jgi:hypothetical protein
MSFLGTGPNKSPSGTDLAAAFELTMIARAHLIGFYARIRPARTGPVHRAAAAILRHRPIYVSPTTLTSGISGQDLSGLEAAGWLEPRDEETVRGLAHRFTPTQTILAGCENVATKTAHAPLLRRHSSLAPVGMSEIWYRKVDIQP